MTNFTGVIIPIQWRVDPKSELSLNLLILYGKIVAEINQDAQFLHELNFDDCHPDELLICVTYDVRIFGFVRLLLSDLFKTLNVRAS